MTSKKSLYYFLFLVVVILLTSSVARAESSGWVHPSALKKFSDQMKAKGLVPVKMACKGDSKSSSIRDSMLINMEFTRLPAKKRWRWAWGRSYGKTKHNLESKGWKLVSASGFVRPNTGLAVRCGIFHAP